MAGKKKAAVETETKIVAYKGFSKEFKCRDFQFEVGKTYEHEGAVKPCSSGFHACENPFDVWGYYDMLDSRFAVVELSGETKKHGDDTKIAAARITVTAELTLPEFITKGINWLIDYTKGKGDDPGGDDAQIGSSGGYARIGSSGGYAQIGSSGYSARIGSSGYNARIGSSGNSARIGSSGNSARIGSSGNSAQIGSSGDDAQIGSSGGYARIGSSGGYARIGSSGYSARIEASGKNSVIASAGYNATAKGADGTWISLAEFDRDGKCIGFATGCIGQDGLEPDTLYCAHNGKLVKA